MFPGQHHATRLSLLNLSSLEKALALRVDSETDPVLVAVTRFNLGRALWEAGRRAQGRRTVSEAERELAAIGDPGEEDLTAVRKWLAAH